jgi:hypothetical protein
VVQRDERLYPCMLQHKRCAELKRQVLMTGERLRNCKFSYRAVPLSRSESMSLL